MPASAPFTTAAQGDIVDQIVKYFGTFDIELTGLIPKTTFLNALRKISPDVSDDHFGRLFDAGGMDGVDALVRYEEFLHWIFAADVPTAGAVGGNAAPPGKYHAPLHDVTFATSPQETPPPHDDDDEGREDTARMGFQSVPELYKAVQEAKVNMGLEEFRQFCQEVGHLEEGITPEDIDVIFSKVVPEGMDKIDVFDFHTALQLVAGKKGRLAKVNAATGNLDGSTGQASPSTASEDPAPPPRPKGMVLPENVTPEMKARQWVDPQKWSMTFDQLVDVLNHCQSTEAYRRLSEYSSKNGTAEHKGCVSMYDVDVNFVRPWSKGTGCGVSVLMNPDEGVEAQLMLSHAWGEDLPEFKEALLTWQKDNQAPGSLRLWFCVFANYQCQDNAGPDIPTQIKLDPFAKVIQSEAVKLVKGGRGMVAIHTTTCDLYGRLWCVHEVERAITTGVDLKAAFSTKYTEKVEAAVKDIMTLGGSFDSALAAAGVKVQTATAACSRDEDRKMLIKLIVKLPGQFERLNEVVCGFRKQALPDRVMWEFVKGGYTPLDSIDKYDRAFMLAILALGKVGFDRFDQINGELQDDPCVQMFGCRATTMSRKFASHIAEGFKMSTESRPIDDVSDGLSMKDATMNSAILQALRHVHYDVLLSLRDDESVAVRAAAEKAYQSGITTGEADAEEEGEEEKKKDAERERRAVEKCMEHIRTLNDDEEGIYQRQWAAQALGDMGERAPPEAFAALTQHFRAHIDSDDWGVKLSAAAAAGAVGQMNPTSEIAAEAGVALIGRLDDEHLCVRRAAAEALGQMGERARPEAGVALTGLLDDHDEIVRRAAAEALGKMGERAPREAVAALVGRLEKDDCVDVIRAAAEALFQKMGVFPPEACVALNGRLDHHNEEVRRAAAEALGKMGVFPPEAVAALIGRLDHHDEYVRSAAAKGLGKMGARAPPEAGAVLIGRLDDHHGNAREAAAEALGKMGERAPREAVVALVGRLEKDDCVDVIEAAAEALFQKMGVFPPEAVAALIGRLDHHHEYVRRAAAEALGKMGERAPPEAVAALVGRLEKHSCVDVIEAAAEALFQKMGVFPPDAGVALTEMLSPWYDEKVQKAAAKGLGKMGERAPPKAGVELISWFKRTDADFRRVAAEALGNIGERAAPGAVVELIGRLDDLSYHVQKAAAMSLGKICECAPTEVVVNLLVESWLQRADASNRLYAVETFGKLGERAPSVVAPALAKTLAADQSLDVHTAVKALRNVLTGNNLRVTAIVDALLRGLQSGSYDVKHQCMCALAQVLKAANRMSKVWTQELAQRFGRTPEEIDERVKLVCEGDIEAARFLSRAPSLASQPVEHGG